MLFLVKLQHMRKIIWVLFIFSLSIVSKAQTTITSFSPAKFYTQSEPTMMSLNIYGSNIWPSWMDNELSIQLIHVHFKKAGKDEVVQMNSHSGDLAILSFSSADWLTTPGPIEVYLTIESFGGSPADRSNSLWLPVEAAPKLPPVITDISNHLFKAGENKGQYTIVVSGKNFGEIRSTNVSIGAYTTVVGWETLETENICVWVPAELINTPGIYPVVVHTKYGESNAMNLTIEKPATTAGQPKAIKNINNNQRTVLNNTRNPLTVNALGEINYPADRAVRLKATMTKGIRVTITGTVADGPTRSAIENFILSHDNVIVDNQLQIENSNANISIKIKGTHVDKSSIDKLKAEIQTKTNVLKMNVPATSIIIEG